MNSTQFLQRAFIVALVGLLLGGCGDASATSTPPPQVATAIPPTATPLPTATLQAQATDDVYATPSVPASETKPTRIQFEKGAISSQLEDSLPSGGSKLYVLTAMANQEMTVNLLDSSTESNAMFSIWGADGTVLISDHAGATTWTGELPATQDYYINVQSLVQQIIYYKLEIIIPPLSDEEPQAPEVMPVYTPVGFESLYGLGLPLMLPPEFPSGGEGLPPVAPHVITAEPDQYEISLDYGPECQGAGACHYGSLAGKKTGASEPSDTRTIVFEAERAQKVTLAKNIDGYFVEALCGANCDDAKVFWIYNGFQYMIGIKAGAQEDVVNLANAAIVNSVP